MTVKYQNQNESVKLIRILKQFLKILRMKWDDGFRNNLTVESVNIALLEIEKSRRQHIALLQNITTLFFKLRSYNTQ